MTKTDDESILKKNEWRKKVGACVRSYKYRFKGGFNMKKKTLLLVIITALILILCSCSMKDGDFEPGDISGGIYKMSGSESDGGDGDDRQEEFEIPAGQLTAGEWNDLDNMEFWKKLTTETENLEDGSLKRALETYKNLDQGTLSLVKVAVSSQGEPVFNANVKLFNGEEVIDTAFTDVQGKAYVFAGDKEGTRIEVSYGEKKEEVELNKDAQPFTAINVELNNVRSSAKICQLMFVVDTTGSMGDEIDYLKSEIKDVAAKISAASEEKVTLQIALLFYRDKGDEYVTRYFPFTENIDEVTKNISAQEAQGGGDFEEAVDVAFTEAVDKQWLENASKLIIHVADAPHHYKDVQDSFDNAYNDRYFTAIEKMREKGIRLVSVASSGVDKVTELLMRQHGMLTGGTYVFLTNHSGIGEEKIIPTVGDYVVEYLNDCLVRVAVRYLLGVEIEPVPYNQKQGQ